MFWPYSASARDLVILVLSPQRYPGLITQDDVDIPPEAQHIPKVECWHPDGIPLAAIEQVIKVTVQSAPGTRRNGLPDALSTPNGELEVRGTEGVAECAED
jgi:hypothetical protein